MKIKNMAFTGTSRLICDVLLVILAILNSPIAQAVDNITVVKYYPEPWQPWGDTVEIINANPVYPEPYAQLLFNVNSTNFSKIGQIFKPVEDFNLGAIAIEVSGYTIIPVDCNNKPFEIEIFTMSDANATQPDTPGSPIATFNGTFSSGFSASAKYTDWVIFYFDQPSGVALTAGNFYGFLFSFTEEHPTQGGDNQYFDFGMDSWWLDESGKYPDGRRFMYSIGTWDDQGSDRVSLEFAVLSEGEPIPLCDPINNLDFNGDCVTGMYELSILTGNWLEDNIIF